MRSHFFLVLLLAFFADSAQAEIHRFREVTRDAIFRGAQPEDEQDYEMLRKVGVRTILNLRKTEDAVEAERAAAKRFGMQFRHVPLPAFVVPAEEDVAQALEYLIDPKLQPVFVHCQFGKDRTGLLIGLHRVLHENVAAEEAYEEMLDLGFNPWLLGLDMYFWAHVPERAGAAFTFQTP